MQTNARLAKYLNPWKFRREEAARQQRLADLRRRDGDNCQRCRRPLRFEVAQGDGQAPTFHVLASSPSEGILPPIENQCLVHVRCNASGADHTPEVTERVRRKNEAALFARDRKRA